MRLARGWLWMGAAAFLEAGSGYLSQHTKSLMFGLGHADAAKSVSITWPSGAVQHFENLQAGFAYLVTEGESHVNKNGASRAPRTGFSAGGGNQWVSAGRHVAARSDSFTRVRRRSGLFED